MTIKNRGIRLKQQLTDEDQGHQTLLEVTLLRENLLGQIAAIKSDGPALPPAPERDRLTDKQLILRARRRAMARILREGLEDTLLLLDDTLRTARRQGRDRAADPSVRVG